MVLLVMVYEKELDRAELDDNEEKNGNEKINIWSSIFCPLQCGDFKEYVTNTIFLWYKNPKFLIVWERRCRRYTKAFSFL